MSFTNVRNKSLKSDIDKYFYFNNSWNHFFFLFKPPEFLTLKDFSLFTNIEQFYSSVVIYLVQIVWFFIAIFFLTLTSLISKLKNVRRIVQCVETSSLKWSKGMDVFTQCSRYSVFSSFSLIYIIRSFNITDSIQILRLFSLSEL